MKTLKTALFSMALAGLFLAFSGCFGGSDYETYYCDDECCYLCYHGDCQVDSCYDDTGGSSLATRPDDEDTQSLPEGLCAPCTVDEDCSAGICIENFDTGETFCATSCGSEDCPGDFTCISLEEEPDGSPFVCVPNSDSCEGLYVEPGAVEEEENSDPEAGETEDNSGETRPGTEGVRPSGNTGSDPEAQPASGECTLNEDCAEGQSCMDGECVFLCFEDSECGNGSICEDFMCIEDISLIECYGNSDCGDGELCIDGQCTLLCLDDEDCSEGFACIDNSCVPLDDN